MQHALAGLFGPLLPAGCPVRFGPPADEPGLDLFLVAVREDPTSSGTDWEDVRDATGRVVARRPPVRRFDLEYAATAHATEMLDAVLIATDPGRRLDPALLSGSLAGRSLTLRLTPVAPLFPRTTLGVTVSAPLVLPLVTEIDRAPDELSLGVDRPGRAARPVPPRRTPPPLRRRLTEDDDTAAAHPA